MGKNHVLNAETGYYDAKVQKLDSPMREAILQMIIPGFPDYRFEWHPNTRKLYSISRLSTPEIAEPIATGVENRQSAELLTTIWASGFDVGRKSMALRGAEAQAASGETPMPKRTN